jgi:hypothetical protein
VCDHFGRPAVFHNNAGYRLFGQIGKELATFAQYDATTGPITTGFAFSGGGTLCVKAPARSTPRR